MSASCAAIRAAQQAGAAAGPEPLIHVLFLYFQDRHDSPPVQWLKTCWRGWFAAFRWGSEGLYQCKRKSKKDPIGAKYLFTYLGL